MSKRAAELFLNDTLPLDPFDGIDADAGRLRRAALGDDRHAARPGAPQHAEGPRRAGAGRRGARRPDARPRSLAPRHRHRHASPGAPVSFFPRGDSLGVVLPNNSPGVHSLWAPATVLKMPLVLKPGSAEPWTPYRMIQAWLKAGCPPEAFSFYPTRPRRRQRDPAPHRPRHGLRRRQGDRALAQGRRPRRDPRPGFSKVVLGADALADWERTST